MIRAPQSSRGMVQEQGIERGVVERHEALRCERERSPTFRALPDTLRLLSDTVGIDRDGIAPAAATAPGSTGREYIGGLLHRCCPPRH